MGQGDKSSLFAFVASNKDDKAKSANPTKIGTIRRKTGEDKTWVQKLPSSKQEVLIECMTGEIYRYLIGELQPKIRTQGVGTILSEFVSYRSVREVFGGDAKHPEYRQQIVGYKRAFLDHIDGFMRVLFSSIFMEENDLSDQNYGLAILTKAREAEDEEFIKVGEMTAEGYGEFIKIDHGQSLNSMRISDKASLARPVYGTAKIKYYPPPAGAGLDTHGLDKRTMKQRQTIWFTIRKYTISPVFVDRIIIHFLLGFIDEAYIREMAFQPSALPLYDGRLLTFFTDMPDKYDRCETAKIEAIAKIVFTKDELIRGIASHASHQDPSFAQKRTVIIDKIIANKEALFQAIRTDPDFCYYCHMNQAAIRDEINRSFQRIIHSRPKHDVVANSDRYFNALHAIDPVDAGKLNAIASVGQQLARGNLRDDARDAIRAIIDILSSHDWKARGSGGHPVKITENMTKVLPETAAEMARTLIRYRLSPVARCYRTLAELSYLSYLAEWKKSFWRTPETQRGYVNILSKLTDLARTYPVVQFIMDKYNREKAEPFLDYYELSRSLNTEVNRMNMQLGIH